VDSIIEWIDAQVVKIDRDLDRIRLRQVQRSAVPITAINQIVSDARVRSADAKASYQRLRQRRSAVRTGRGRLAAAASQFGPIWDYHLGQAERQIAVHGGGQVSPDVVVPIHLLVLAADSAVALSVVEQRLHRQESAEIADATEHVQRLDELRQEIVNLEVAIRAASREQQRSERSRTTAEEAASQVRTVLDEYADLIPPLLRLVEEKAGSEAAFSLRTALEVDEPRPEITGPES
jgi:hypothetical protein